MGTANREEAKDILAKLTAAKVQVAKLEQEYRKVCFCNERLPGADERKDSYRNPYNTCEYHRLNVFHAQKGTPSVISYA